MIEALPPFSWGALLRGTPIYAFREFYRAKDVLLRYDERTGYLNYGWWGEGEATPNPSAALVARMLDRLQLGPDDHLLDVGSGLGEPDADAARTTPVARVVGVNRDAAQVAHANARFLELGLADRVEHHVHDAHELASLGETFTAAISVEAIAEMPDLDRVLAGLRAVLRPGARLVLCDVVRSGGGWGRAITWVTRLLYGDHWRTVEELEAALARAGFQDVHTERIGDRVYPYTWRHARSRLRGLWRSERAGAAGLLACANLGGLAGLYRCGQVDYAIVTARARGA